MKTIIIITKDERYFCNKGINLRGRIKDFKRMYHKLSIKRIYYIDGDFKDIITLFGVKKFVRFINNIKIYKRLDRI